MSADDANEVDAELELSDEEHGDVSAEDKAAEALDAADTQYAEDDDGKPVADADKPSTEAKTDRSVGDDEHKFDKARQQEQQKLANAERKIEQMEAQSAAEVAQQAAAEVDPDEDPIAKLDRLEKSNAQLTATVQALTGNQQANQDMARYDNFLTSMDKKHGAELRNEALQLAVQYGRDHGLTDADISNLSITDKLLLVERGYTDTRIARLEKGGGKVVKGGKRPAADTGKTGSATVSKLSKGTPDEVRAAMEKEGKLDGSKYFITK